MNKLLKKKTKKYPTPTELMEVYEIKYNFELSNTFKENVLSSTEGKPMTKDKVTNIKNLLWGAFLQSNP